MNFRQRCQKQKNQTIKPPAITTRNQKNMKLIKLIAAVAASALAVCGLSARSIIDNTDVDIVFEYDAGVWEVFLFDTITEEEFDPAEAYLRMNENSMRTRPAGAAFDFIGPEGTTIWYLPEADPGAPYDSLYGAHEVGVDPGVFVDNQATLTFPSIVTPDGGHVHLWVEDVFGNPTLVFSSDPAAGAPNFYTFPDLSDTDHIHKNWAFTAEGIYEFDMRIDADLAAGGSTFVVDNVQFQVIPEPTAYSLFGGMFAAVALLWLRRRSRGQSSSRQ